MEHSAWSTGVRPTGRGLTVFLCSLCSMPFALYLDHQRAKVFRTQTIETVAPLLQANITFPKNRS